MISGYIRLDLMRYQVRTGDTVKQIYEVGSIPFTFRKTTNGNLLITRKEKYECEIECSENGKEFDMVIAIRNSNGFIIPGKLIEDKINNDGEIVEWNDFILNYTEPYNDEEVLKAIEDIRTKYPTFEI